MQFSLDIQTNVIFLSALGALLVDGVSLIELSVQCIDSSLV